jgi:hypothetical protein
VFHPEKISNPVFLELKDVNGSLEEELVDSL